MMIRARERGQWACSWDLLDLRTLRSRSVCLLAVSSQIVDPERGGGKGVERFSTGLVRF
jgi:hypothetical protein